MLTSTLEVQECWFGGVGYIEDNPEEPGVMCLRMELSLSPAIVKRFCMCKLQKRIGGDGQEWWLFLNVQVGRSEALD